MGSFENKSFTAHCQNVKNMFDVEFQTSFSHSRTTFFKNFGLIKVGKFIYISSPKIHLIFQASNQKIWTNFKEDI